MLVNKTALQLAARFALPPNSLGYCGKETAPQRFNSCVINGECTHVDEELSKFIVLHPYLKTIGQLTNKNTFDYEVVEAYCLGNDLLKNIKPSGYDSLLDNFLLQGVPEWFVKDLRQTQPKRFIPHHLFQVLHVGVGKASGAVPFNLESINSCMIRWGEVTKLSNKELTANLAQMAVEKSKFAVSHVTEKLNYNAEFLKKVEVGSTIAVHWNQVIKVLTKTEEKNLAYWTNEIINSVAPTLQ